MAYIVCNNFPLREVNVIHIRITQQHHATQTMTGEPTHEDPGPSPLYVIITPSPPPPAAGLEGHSPVGSTCHPFEFFPNL